MSITPFFRQTERGQGDEVYKLVFESTEFRCDRQFLTV